jgi:hypothetical protein
MRKDWTRWRLQRTKPARRISMRYVSARYVSATILVFLMAACPLGAAQEEDSPSVELVVATDVQDREPVGEGTMFPADVGQLVAWSRVSGAADTTIEHVWRFADAEVEAVVPLQIGGSPWRTWSTKQIPPEWAGDWVVEVRDQAGNVLATASVTVGP